MDSSQSTGNASTTNASANAIAGVMASASEFLDENVYKRRLLSQGAEAVSLPFVSSISLCIYAYVRAYVYVSVFQSSLTDDMPLIEDL